MKNALNGVSPDISVEMSEIHREYRNDLDLEVDKLNWKGIEFPMKLNKINSFEKLNNISINVYSLDNELNLYPLRFSERLSTSVYTYYSFRRKKKGIISL